jgi:predicted nucleotidyltransferase component of viral defense system
MIPDFCLTEWRQQTPWVEDYQVEQDLLISRALISLYERPRLKNSLVFRGGTALHKLYIQPAARYSEDIDLVQIVAEPIGQILDEIRSALDWLGEPTRKLTERSVKLFYRYTALDNSKRKLKIEINTTEHYHFSDLVDCDFSVKNSWFTGNLKLRTYQLNELMGTKMRALYQRRKGRDLFDLWLALKDNLIDPQAVIDIYMQHCEREGNKVTRALFEKSMADKLRYDEFRHDIAALLANEKSWMFEDAHSMVQEKLIRLLPGKPWRKK